MEAQIRINTGNLKHLSIAVLLLATLLSAFFWLGFWTATLDVVSYDRSSVSVESPQGAGAAQKLKTFPLKPSPVTPVDKLDIDPRGIVRL